MQNDRNHNLIGIWWMQGELLVALREEFEAGHEFCGWWDSHLEHWQEWPKVAHQYGFSADDEYFWVPRGRCQFNHQKGIGRILHGPETTKIQIAKIAVNFGYSEYETLEDGHYRLQADPEDF